MLAVEQKQARDSVLGFKHLNPGDVGLRSQYVRFAEWNNQVWIDVCMHERTNTRTHA